MLKYFRKKIVMKVVLWGLIIIVVPAFVLWGGASMQKDKTKGPTYAGFVYNRKVSLDELSNALSGVRSQIILNYFNQPKVLDVLLSNKPLMAKLAWDRVLMMEEARRAGIKISDKEVVAALQSHPLFLRNGVFDDRFYAYVLRNNIGMEPRAFEEIVRDNLALQRLSATHTKDVKVTDDEVLAEYKKEFGSIRISYVLLEPKDYLDKINIGENAAKDFYEKNKVELKVKSNLKGALPDRPATFEESKADIEKYLKEAEVGKALKEKAEETHKALLDRTANNGETFAKAAAKLGLSAKDTDFFSKKDAMEDIGGAPMIVANSYELKDFELSNPLATNKGYIIFEVVARKTPEMEAFAKEKEEYTKKVREMRASVVMEKWLKELEDKAKLAIKLEDAAKDYK